MTPLSYTTDKDTGVITFHYDPEELKAWHERKGGMIIAAHNTQFKFSTFWAYWDPFKGPVEDMVTYTAARVDEFDGPFNPDNVINKPKSPLDNPDNFGLIIPRGMYNEGIPKVDIEYSNINDDSYDTKRPLNPWDELHDYAYYEKLNKSISLGFYGADIIAGASKLMGRMLMPDDVKSFNKIGYKKPNDPRVYPLTPDQAITVSDKELYSQMYHDNMNRVIESMIEYQFPGIENLQVEHAGNNLTVTYTGNKYSKEVIEARVKELFDKLKP